MFRVEAVVRAAVGAVVRALYGSSGGSNVWVRW